MQTLDFNILYVADVAASTAFYRDLLDRPPVESAPTFAMFTFGNRVMLGLWGLDGVKPPAAVGAGGSEMAFVVMEKDGIDAMHADWVARGITIAMPPTELDFGYSFVALDPDGHRIRVMKPADM
eukprot:gene20957-21705_t